MRHFQERESPLAVLSASLLWADGPLGADSIPRKDPITVWPWAPSDLRKQHCTPLRPQGRCAHWQEKSPSILTMNRSSEQIYFLLVTVSPVREAAKCSLTRTHLGGTVDCSRREASVPE